MSGWYLKQFQDAQFAIPGPGHPGFPAWNVPSGTFSSMGDRTGMQSSGTSPDVVV
ncbi:hypothetical protein BV25DRAFT_1824246, partial [Artomyces pyxidatus]